jgi:hypothetical protein
MRQSNPTAPHGTFAEALLAIWASDITAKLAEGWKRPQQWRKGDNITIISPEGREAAWADFGGRLSAKLGW